MERKIKRARFSVDILFDDFIEKKHLKEMAKKITDALRHEVDSGMGLAPEDEDSNATTKEIRTFSEEAGVSIVKYENGRWNESFIDVDNSKIPLPFRK